MQPGVDGQARFRHHLRQLRIAVAKLGVAVGRIAQKVDGATAPLDQTTPRVTPALPIVAADRHPQRMVVNRSPTHEMRPLRYQLLQPHPLDLVIAIAQQDDAVGLAAILIIDMPVGR